MGHNRDAKNKIKAEIKAFRQDSIKRVEEKFGTKIEFVKRPLPGQENLKQMEDYYSEERTFFPSRTMFGLIDDEKAENPYTKFKNDPSFEDEFYAIYSKANIFKRNKYSKPRKWKAKILQSSKQVSDLNDKKLKLLQILQVLDELNKIEKTI